MREGLPSLLIHLTQNDEFVLLFNSCFLLDFKSFIDILKVSPRPIISRVLDYLVVECTTRNFFGGRVYH
jgi:hypothetical protein